ncbi:hypothetical protein D3C76_1781400 [compost metagenome]
MDRVAVVAEGAVSLDAYIAVAVDIYGSSIVTPGRPKPPPPSTTIECRSSLGVVFVFPLKPVPLFGAAVFKVFPAVPKVVAHGFFHA